MPTNKTAANDSKNAPRSQLTHEQHYKLMKWIESAEVAQFAHVQACADAAAKTLGFRLTRYNMESALDLAGIEHFKRPKVSDDGKLALELARATATALHDFMRGMGEKASPEFAQALRTAGIEVLPLDGRKAA